MDNKIINKIAAILCTLIPRTSVTINRKSGSNYMVVLERKWMGRKTTVQVAAKNAQGVDNLLTLL